MGLWFNKYYEICNISNIKIRPISCCQNVFCLFRFTVKRLVAHTHIAQYFDETHLA